MCLFRGTKSSATPEVVKISAQKAPIRHVLTENERKEYQELLGLHHSHKVFFGAEYGLDTCVIESEQNADF